MGAGPEHLLQAGLAAHLAHAGHQVKCYTLEASAGAFRTEVGTALDIMCRLAIQVREARSTGAFPLVLAGNCSTAVGTIAGLGSARPGVLWFDAHGDFNTPDTTPSGFFDGMALATLAGRCWTQVVGRVPGFLPVAESRICLIGARDLDALESELLAGSEVELVTPVEMAVRLPAAVKRLATEIDEAYEHIDLDVLDPTEGCVNQFAAAGGVTLGQLEDAVAAIGRALPVGAAALTAYDPSADADGRICAAAFRVAAAVVAARARS